MEEVYQPEVFTPTELASVSGFKEEEKLKLKNFQKVDCDRMDKMPHILLFSEMGTGKTVEAIYHICKNNLLPALIICPNSVKLNWYEEIIRWSEVFNKPIDPYYAMEGGEIVDFILSEDVDEMLKALKRIYIIHHEALAFLNRDIDREMLPTIHWKCVVVDEAHRFRNSDTFRTQALMDFATTTKKFMFLTGTPVVNDTNDLYYMLHMIKAVDEQGNFSDKYIDREATQHGYRTLGTRNKFELLTQLAPIYIRRTKEEVLPELPPKISQVLRLVMPQDQRATYDRFVELLCIILEEGGMIYAPNMLTELLRLRQLNLDPRILGKKSSSSKTDAVIELIEQAPDEKWVIVSTFKQYINFLASYLPEKLNHSSRILTLTGDTPTIDRQQLLKDFQELPQYKVLGMTMQTGGLGINLQSCHNMIVSDLWWNQAAVDQAVDRLHRMGQKHPVHIYYLENEDSIDQLMKEIIGRKQQAADEVVVTSDVIRDIYLKHRGYEYLPPRED